MTANFLGNAATTKPTLPHDGSDESRCSSPHADPKPKPPSGQKLKSISASSDEATDPPKLETRSDKALSVCSDGARSSSSRRSKESSRSAVHVSKRSTWYDEFARPVGKDVARVRLSNDYRPMLGIDHRDAPYDRHRSAVRRDYVPDLRSLRSNGYGSHSHSQRERTKHLISDRWLHSRPVVGSFGDGYEPSRRCFGSRSPIGRAKGLSRYDSFGAIPNGYRERRHHF